MLQRIRLCVLSVVIGSAAAPAQSLASDAAAWAAALAPRYSVSPNTTYLVVDGEELKLDVFTPRDATIGKPVPTIIYLHGGGWTGGDKAVSTLRLLPYLERGFSAVNVNYRTGPAPAAVEDARCALRFVIRNAAKYAFDVGKIVVTGDSAGSHLALTTGLLPASAGLDGKCPGEEALKVAAIVNWFGVTDVVDVIEGPNQKSYAKRWLSGPNPLEVARLVSPLQYVRAGSPPVVTIHGDADPVAPYDHARRLHKALDDAKVPNQLLTIQGGDHGSFKPEEFIRAHAAIRDFLRRVGVEK